ncbi:MAG: peptide chain release factor N(5)-glutamine methyltransferase [Clostridiales bacterium]|nr:peptide chain release factor N(5)-glutamine methyltransferase [Clostridiales bacterium]
MVTINDALIWGKKELEDASASPYLDAQVILMHVLNKDKIYLIVNKQKEISDDEYQLYQSFIAERMTHKPVQYIINRQEFMGLDLYVDQRVLIPRADTEILVESVLEIIKDREVAVRILDIGSGSGAIAIALDLLSENANVVSVDISTDALAVAKLNNDQLKAQVVFLKSDVFSDVDGLFDIIVSNPPYIEKKEYEALDENVKAFEPILALKAEDEGYFFYRKIIEEAFEFLNENGVLAFEVGYNQSKKVKEMMEKKNFKNIRIIQDLSGINRVVIGYRGEINV